MKWDDLSLSERNRIYRSVRRNNPDASYYGIKKAFDEIPSYEDGLRKEDLPLEYQFGTPEYFARQEKISGKVNEIHPEAYITKLGYIDDAVNLVKDLKNKNLKGAAVDLVLNALPFASSKIAAMFKRGKNSFTNESRSLIKDPSKVSDVLEQELENRTRKQLDVRHKYGREIDASIHDAAYPDIRTEKLIDDIDRQYGTHYKRAYKQIAIEDAKGRGNYLSYGPLGTEPDHLDIYGAATRHNTVDNIPSELMRDNKVQLNDNIYVAGTANHELGHVADNLAGSRQYVDYTSGDTYISNPYLRYLANQDDAYSLKELRDLGINISPQGRSYLLNPTEAKSHMLTLKRGLKDKGIIKEWSDPIDEATVVNYINDPESISSLRAQYDLYRNKDNYIERLNKLTPMSWLMLMSMSNNDN